MMALRTPFIPLCLIVVAAWSMPVPSPFRPSNLAASEGQPLADVKRSLLPSLRKPLVSFDGPSLDRAPSRSEFIWGPQTTVAWSNLCECGCLLVVGSKSVSREPILFLHGNRRLNPEHGDHSFSRRIRLRFGSWASSWMALETSILTPRLASFHLTIQTSIGVQ